MMAHTPQGPWRAVVRSNQHGPQMVAVDMAPRSRAWSPTRTNLTDQDVADARLIAAAPDLLAALKAAEEYMAFCATECSEPFPLERARAAIAKAEGR